jgi:hypothetical protein
MGDTGLATACATIGSVHGERAPDDGIRDVGWRADATLRDVGRPDDGIRDVGWSVHQVMRSLGGGERFGAVSSRWSELVGVTVADHAQPCGLRNGVLVIGVREPGWATQLRFLGPEIVERCDAALGPDVVERVEVRVLRSSA